MDVFWFSDNDYCIAIFIFHLSMFLTFFSHIIWEFESQKVDFNAFFENFRTIRYFIYSFLNVWRIIIQVLWCNIVLCINQNEWYLLKILPCILFLQNNVLELNIWVIELFYWGKYLWKKCPRARSNQGQFTPPGHSVILVDNKLV